MAKILRDYKCETHGFFENWVPVCPAGCEEDIKQVYLRAPSIGSARTKGIDKTLTGLAKDFGMTDIKSSREGDYQAGFYNRNNSKPEPEAPKEPRSGDQAIWGGDNRFNMGNLLKGGVVRPVRDEAVGVRPQDVGNLTGPKAGSFIPDHENLKVK